MTTPVGDGEHDAWAVIQQTDGKLVVAGLSYNQDFTDSSISLVRYLSNGDPDPEFGGGDGKVETNVAELLFDNAFALIQQQDGKLVVTGYSDADLVVVRYDTSGTPDSSFGGRRRHRHDGRSGRRRFARALLEQATDHKLVVAGRALDRDRARPLRDGWHPGHDVQWHRHRHDSRSGPATPRRGG